MPRIFDNIHLELLAALRQTMAVFHSIDGKDICRVTANRSPRLVYVKEGNDALYIRAGNSTKQAIDYAASRKAGGSS